MQNACCRELSAVQRKKVREGPESAGGRLLAQHPPQSPWHLSQMAMASKILHRVTQMPPGVPSGSLDSNVHNQHECPHCHKMAIGMRCQPAPEKGSPTRGYGPVVALEGEPQSPALSCPARTKSCLTLHNPLALLSYSS